MGSDIPSDIQNKFWGIKDAGPDMSELDKAAASFYAGPQGRQAPDMSQQQKAMNYTNFFGGDPNVPVEFDEGRDYTYDEARKIADSMK
jgi:hypothetical protein